jgi:hypothetical protein
MHRLLDSVFLVSDAPSGTMSQMVLPGIVRFNFYESALQLKPCGIAPETSISQAKGCKKNILRQKSLLHAIRLRKGIL